MTEERFTELVNLYLDKEISERGLRELRAELSSNAERKAEFRERCQLHQAMRLALDPKVGGKGRRRRLSSSEKGARPATRVTHEASRGKRRGEKRSGRSSRAHLTRPGDSEAEKTVEFQRWVLGTGLAASFALGFVLLAPMMRDVAPTGDLLSFGGGEIEQPKQEDPLDSVGRSEIRRFANVQEQRSMNQRASIAAELRLLGLRPEVTPRDKELHQIDLAAVQIQDTERDPVRLLQDIQAIESMPAPRILRLEFESDEPVTRWPSGFESSLASF